jgi:hypothetical protein
MHRPELIRQALVRLGLVVTLVVLAISACGEGEEEVKARPLPEVEKALRPGEYRSEEFKPSFSFRVGKGWTNLPPEASDTLFITRGERMALGFVKPQEVYKPTRTGTPNVVDAPRTWSAGSSNIRTCKPINQSRSR